MTTVRDALDSITIRELMALARVSRATITAAKDRGDLMDTPAGRRMRRVLEERCGLDPLEPGRGRAGRLADRDADPIRVQIKRAELAMKEAGASEKERKNAEAESRLLPADEVAARIGHAGAQLRTGLDGVRREIEAQLPDDCRDAILATFDAGVGLTVGADEGMGGGMMRVLRRRLMDTPALGAAMAPRRPLRWTRRPPRRARCPPNCPACRRRSRADRAWR